LRNCSENFDERDARTAFSRPVSGIRVSGSQGQPHSSVKLTIDDILRVLVACAGRDEASKRTGDVVPADNSIHAG